MSSRRPLSFNIFWASNFSQTFILLLHSIPRTYIYSLIPHLPCPFVSLIFSFLFYLLLLFFLLFPFLLLSIPPPPFFFFSFPPFFLAFPLPPLSPPLVLMFSFVHLCILKTIRATPQWKTSPVRHMKGPSEKEKVLMGMDGENGLCLCEVERACVTCSGTPMCWSSVGYSVGMERSGVACMVDGMSVEGKVHRR